jgi:hypothetical protein
MKSVKNSEAHQIHHGFIALCFNCLRRVSVLVILVTQYAERHGRETNVSQGIDQKLIGAQEKLEELRKIREFSPLDSPQETVTKLGLSIGAAVLFVGVYVVKKVVIRR